MSRIRSLSCLILTAVLWSSGGVLIKSVDWSPFGIAGTRAAIAALAIFAVHRKLKIQWSVGLIGASVCYAMTTILFVLSNRMTTAANAIFLQYTAPIYVALFGGWFLGERSTKWDWLTIVVALGGMALFFLDQLTVSNFWGNIVALASGFTFAWLTLFMRKEKDRSTIEPILLGNLIAACATLPLVHGPIPSWKGIGILSVLGVFQLAAPYFLYTKAVKGLSAIEVTTVLFIEPVLNPIWVLLCLGERPGRMAMIGGAILLVTVAVRAIQKSGSKKIDSDSASRYITKVEMEVS